MSPSDRRSFARREVRSRAWTFARGNWWQLSAVLGIYAIAVVIGRLLGGKGYWQGVVEGGLFVTVVAWLCLHFMLHTGSLDSIAGAQGEGRTAEALTKAQKLGYVWGAVHNVELDRGDIDSVVVTPAGVLAIETKWMTRELDRRWLGKHLQQATDAARKTRSILRSADVVKEVHDVKPVLVIWGAARADIAAGGEAHDEVDVIDGDELVGWLQQFRTGSIASDNAERLLPTVEVIANEHTPPSEGCGGASRTIFLTGRARDDDALLTVVAAEMTEAGWGRADCVFTSERCFRRDALFVSLASAYEVVGPREDGVPWFAKRRDNVFPQVIAALQVSRP